MSNAEVADDILGKRSTRKRGNSRYPRRCQLLLLVSSSFSFNYFQLLIIQILNISNLNISEPPRLTSRGRRFYESSQRSNSWWEYISQLDSPASNKRNRLPRAIEQAAVSSPASNTRSRCSSIQSIESRLSDRQWTKDFSENPATPANLLRTAQKKKKKNNPRDSSKITSCIWNAVKIFLIVFDFFSVHLIFKWTFY